MTVIPTYPPTTAVKKIEDPVARSMAKPNACDKPCSVGKVRVRTTMGDKSLKRKRKRRTNDKSDVTLY